MKYRTEIQASISEVLQMLDDMPKERGNSWGKGLALQNSLGRTYTDIVGNNFQISETAGMGGTPTCIGELTEYETYTAVNVQFKFGVLPNSLWLLVAIVSLIAIPISYWAAHQYSLIGFSVLSLCASLFHVKNYYDSKYLLSELSKYLKEPDWKRL